METFRVFRNHLLTYNQYFHSDESIKRLNREAKDYSTTNCYKLYQQLIKDEASLISSLASNNSNPYYLTAIFYFLYWNGYFSKDKSFEFKKTRPFIDPGVNLSAGTSVCLSIASHFRDILSEYKYFNPIVVGIRTSDKDKDNVISTRISQHICEEHEEENRLINHANVLTIFNGELFLIDPTNFLIYHMRNKVAVFEPFSYVELRACIPISIKKDKQSLKEYLRNIESKNLQLSMLSREIEDKKSLQEYMNLAYQECLRQIDIIEKFYKEHQSIYETISEYIPQDSEPCLKRV